MSGIKTAVAVGGAAAIAVFAVKYLEAQKKKRASASTIMYTYTDEAPMLATHAFFPIVKAFCAHAGIDVQLKDISVAGRVLAQFPEYLTAEQQVSDILMDLGKLAQSGDANIIKLPNISASIPQLKECIKELQEKGFALPNYPEDPKDDKEKAVKEKYGKVLGSAVNPVLREGNSDRRAAVPVKEYAFRFPHSMGKWQPSSRTVVRSMKDGDFYSHERSVCVKEACDVRIELRGEDGTTTVLKEKVPLKVGEVIDGTFMDAAMLREFYEESIQEAKASGVLFSLHLKATMMKVSDPIMFGHCVKVYFKDVFAKYKDTFAKLGVDANNGLGDVYKKIATLPDAERKAVEADIMATYSKRGEMAMVDSHKGITNLHVPSDIIIDNSMPTAIRGGGKMWDKSDKEQDFLATIPDRGYACVFHEVVEFCKKNGAFDPKTMGACPNVGLMAQKAEEYGSHPCTFEIKKPGTVCIVVNGSNTVLMGHKVSIGDIYRSCQTKDAPIKDWVKLAVNRCRANNFPNNDKPCKAIFWLDPARAHDVILMDKVQKYLPMFNPQGLDIEIMSPVDATRVTCQRAKDGLNTITVTGNVLRDYLTDLFPILERGTSAKMLSIVPMLAGGAMYETGAGGSAPKHVQQFTKEGHLRWDSLGEYLALSCAFADMAEGNPKAKVLADALDKAVGNFLTANKNPSRKVKEIDNRGSHYWVARYWADELSKQEADKHLKETFEKTAKELADDEAKVLQDLVDCQGTPMDIGGYYKLDKAKADAAMNPSQTLNSIVSRLSRGASAKA
jgi:isocitrate dehydrogenase